MKILVVGGHGFLGTSLVEILSRKGHDVAALSRRDGLDLMDLERVRSQLALHRPQVIFNCAAHVGGVHYVMKNAAAVIRDNVQMATNLYQAVSLIDPAIRMVNPLSNCSYPGNADVHFEPDWLVGEPHRSVYAYGYAKRFIYVIAGCYHDQFGIRSLNFLVPNTFGVGDHLDTDRTHAISGMIVRMLNAKQRGEARFEVWGSGRPVREWGYIDDMAEIISRGAEMDVDLAYPVNIAQNSGASIGDTARAIAKAVGYTGELWFNTRYEDGAPRKVLDDRRFRELFPDYVFVDHEEAIHRTVRYYEKALAQVGVTA